MLRATTKKGTCEWCLRWQQARGPVQEVWCNLSGAQKQLTGEETPLCPILLSQGACPGLCRHRRSLLAHFFRKRNASVILGGISRAVLKVITIGFIVEHLNQLSCGQYNATDSASTLRLGLALRGTFSERIMPLIFKSIDCVHYLVFPQTACLSNIICF